MTVWDKTGREPMFEETSTSKDHALLLAQRALEDIRRMARNALLDLRG